MWPKRFFSAVMLLWIAGLPQLATGAPTCVPPAPPAELTYAKAIRVEKNGVIVLADGRAARLEGILLPDGANDRAPQLFAEQAISALADMTANHVVLLVAAPPKEDRYDRIRAQFIVRAGIWVQKDMLRRGLARVAIAPDRGECVEELYAAEAQARRDKSGLWSSPTYAVRAPSDAADNVGTFQIVQGKVSSVSSSGGRIFLDFTSDEGAVFAATISTEDMKRFREIGVDPYAYAGETVRVRGWIERLHGLPEIALATPAQVEMVQSAK